MTSKACRHSQAHYRPAISEDGWHCDNCHKRLAFRPDLDRTYLLDKIESLMQTMHEADLIYISNHEMGAIVAENVRRQAIKTDVYDQYGLLTLILTDANLAGHTSWWRTQSVKWLDSQKEATR